MTHVTKMDYTIDDAIILVSVNDAIAMEAYDAII